MIGDAPLFPDVPIQGTDIVLAITKLLTDHQKEARAVLQNIADDDQYMDYRERDQARTEALCWLRGNTLEKVDRLCQEFLEYEGFGGEDRLGSLRETLLKDIVKRERELIIRQNSFKGVVEKQNEMINSLKRHMAEEIKQVRHDAEREIEDIRAELEASFDDRVHERALEITSGVAIKSSGRLVTS